MKTLILFATLGLIAPAGHWGTDCDPLRFKPIISERTGALLYWNNPTCPPAQGSTDSAAQRASEGVSGGDTSTERKGNRSGLGDGTNPGRGGGRDNSPNEGTENPNQAGE